MKTLVKFTTIGILAFGLIACEKDDDDNSTSPSTSNNNTNNFTAEITVSGDIEAEKSGVCDFDFLDFGNFKDWSIHANDFSPQTFSFNISDFSQDASRPDTGTYSIGQQNIADYTAIYTHIENQDFQNAEEYGTIFNPNNEEGTLTITVSTETRMEGHFSFMATKVDSLYNPIGEIQVDGSFVAKARE